MIRVTDVCKSVFQYNLLYNKVRLCLIMTCFFHTEFQSYIKMILHIYILFFRNLGSNKISTIESGAFEGVTVSRDL